MLQQQQQQVQLGTAVEDGQQTGASDRRQQLLAKLAVPVDSLLKVEIAASNRPLLAALEQQQVLEELAEAGGAEQVPSTQQPARCTAAGSSSMPTGQAAATNCLLTAGAAADAAASRQLQQLVVLDDGKGLAQQLGNPVADSVDTVTTALSAQPLDAMPGARSSLASLLRPIKPTAGPKAPVFARGTKRTNKVTLSAGFSELFELKKPGASSSTSQDVFWASSFSDEGMIAAAVPKPGADSSSPPTATTATSPALEPDAAAGDDMEQPADSMLTAFDALRPARSLIELEDGAQDSSSHGAAAGSNAVRTEAGRRRRKQGQQHRHTTRPVQHEQLDAVNSQSTPGYAAAAAGFMESGQVQYHTRPRPRPVRPQRQTLEVAVIKKLTRESSSTSSNAALNEQPAWGMMGPKTPIRRKQQQHFSPVAMHFIPEHLQKSELQTSSFESDMVTKAAGSRSATAERGHHSAAVTSSSSSSRQLLQASNTTSSSKGVVVVARVSGFESQAAATASASTLEALVANDTLRSTLAAQGWSATDIGLSFTTTGVNGNLWGTSNLQTIIIAAAAAGGGAILVVLGILLYVRRVRARAAAQVPGANQNAHSYTATSRPSMVSGYTTSANTSYVSSSYPSASYPAQYGAGASAPSPVMPFHPQVYMQQQGRARSNSASPVMGGGYAGPAGPSMLQPAAHANPCAAGQQQQYPAAANGAGPRAQPWADGMRRGASYSTVQQQQQLAYYAQAEQPSVDPVYPFMRQPAASFTVGQQGTGRSGSPARLL
jgi:hypothetical protein